MTLWFYDDLCEWLCDQPTEEGQVYAWSGTYRKRRDGRCEFVGELRPVDVPPMLTPGRPSAYDVGMTTTKPRSITQAQAPDAIRAHENFKASALSGARTYGTSTYGRLPAEWIERMERSDEPVVYVVFSYATPIAWVLADGEVVIPDVRYTPTTDQHQHTCRFALGLAQAA